MSDQGQPPAGWYPDPNDPAKTRYWDGSAWAAETPASEPTEVSQPAEAGRGATPAGWYPDPHDPIRSRYWDGTAWAAPAGAGVPAAVSPVGDGSGRSGGKRALVIVAIVAALALIGGGAWALTSGDDDDHQEVASDDDDPDGEDSGPEEFDADDFADEAQAICAVAEDELDEIEEEYEEEFGDAEGPSDVNPELLESFTNESTEIFEGMFTDLRAVTPEGEVDAWLDLVDDWEDAVTNILGSIVDGDEPDDADDDRYDDVVESLEDYGLSCLGGSSSSDQATADAAPATPSTVSPSATEVEIDTETGPPTAPPIADDPSLQPQVEACYQGDMDACEDLFFEAESDSLEETYGERCGGRVPEEETMMYCPDIEDPVTP